MRQNSVVWVLVVAVALVGLIGVNYLQGLFKEPTLSLLESCWLPAELGKDEVLTLVGAEPPGTGRDAAAPALTFVTGAATMLVNGPSSSSPVSGTQSVHLEGGTIRVPPRIKVIVRSENGGLFSLEENAPVLVPVTGAVGEVNFPNQVEISGGKLKQGELGRLALPGDRDPLRVTLGNSAALHPFVRLSGDTAFKDAVDASQLPSATPPNSLTLGISKATADFDRDKASLRACVLIRPWAYQFRENASNSAKAVAVPIMDVVPLDHDHPGIASVTIGLPPSIEANLIGRRVVAVFQTDGTFIGKDEFWIVSRGVGLAVAALAVFGGHFLIGRMNPTPQTDPQQESQTARMQWPIKSLLPNMSWFIGPGNQASLSLFQIYLWSWVVFGGLIYVLVISGQFFSISPQVLILLGIAGAGSVAARFVATVRGEAGAQQPAPKFSDLLMTGDVFDQSKLQMFLFTTVTALYVLWRIFVDRAFPTLDTNLLLLLGISNGIYVGGKLAGPETPQETVNRLQTEIRRKEDEKKATPERATELQADIDNLKAELEKARRAVPA